MGLSGEVRAVSKIDQRILEADKHGFDRIFVSKYNKGLRGLKVGLRIVEVGQVEDIVRVLFE